MDFRENIKYRESLEVRACQGEKWTSEEKAWAAMNPIYNPLYDYPVFCRDIITLLPNQKYKITVNRLSQTVEKDKFIPLLFISHGKGWITTSFPLMDIDMRLTSKTKTKMLGVHFDNKPFLPFEMEAQLGLLSVAYQCEYFDTFMGCFRRDSSHGAALSYGMLKEQIGENKIVYHCKAPFTDSFDAFSFSVEWEAI